MDSRPAELSRILIEIAKRRAKDKKYNPSPKTPISLMTSYEFDQYNNREFREVVKEIEDENLKDRHYCGAW